MRKDEQSLVTEIGAYFFEELMCSGPRFIESFPIRYTGVTGAFSKCLKYLPTLRCVD
jgi:hypothetical protein